jgi:acetyltransferase-like isoleucine patch superfamily enzyme
MYFKILFFIYNKLIFTICRFRGFIWSLVFDQTGHHIYISSGFVAMHPIGIKFGSHISINRNVTLDGSGILVIGDYVMIGPDTKIYTSNHSIKDGKIMLFEKPTYSNVFIGNNVWIGANVIILPGSYIGDNVVVAAGSIVTKRVNDGEIIAGNPFKVIGLRK